MIDSLGILFLSVDTHGPFGYNSPGFLYLHYKVNILHNFAVCLQSQRGYHHETLVNIHKHKYSNCFTLTIEMFAV